MAVIFSRIIDDSPAKQNPLLLFTIQTLVSPVSSLSSLRLLSIIYYLLSIIYYYYLPLPKHLLQTVMRHINSLCEWHFQVLIPEFYGFIYGLDGDFAGGIV